MHQEQQRIRDLILTWNERSKAGDADAVLDLMTDDVVFTVVGRPPFGKQEFAENMRRMKDLKIDAQAEVIEVTVRGDTAWARVRLRVGMTTPDGKSAPREGYVLSIYTRQADGRWLLARDANLLGPAASSG